MNVSGSYRKLLENSKQAMLAAIEIYNKPMFDYREEVFVILLINAWQLLLLAILSKNQQRIFKPKKRDQEYQTWELSESIKLVKAYFPKNVDHKATDENLSLLKKYRNNAVHYYNQEEVAHCIYVLAQACIRNYRDLIQTIFNQDIVNQINLVLLPLSFNEQPDFIEFFRGAKKKNKSPFVQELFQVMKGLEEDSVDTSRLLTQCTVKLESTKKITTADIIMGVNNENPAGTIVIPPPQNPNKSHPFSRQQIMEKVKPDNPINQYEFEAICWQHGLRNESKNGYKFAWKSDRKASAWCYTSEIIKFIHHLEPIDIRKAKEAYKQHIAKKNKRSL